MSTEQEIILERLRQRASEMSDTGNLLSSKKLNEFRANFVDRFGPRQLQLIDGERLLNTLHDISDRNGLPYWLEFKNDEEFATAQFGSIAGGNALKFGIFKKKETGAWTIGSSTKQEQVSLDAAVEIARKHRNQLIAVCSLLDDLPEEPSDAAYADLQQAIETKAPDLYDYAWAHKYFHLLYPDRLDDYHMESYQRFHLIRALQLPPEAAGRYICAGRFVALARAIELPISSLTEVMNSLAPKPYLYWRVGTRSGNRGESVWPEMQAGHVSVGWSELGDLSGLLHDEPAEWLERLRSLYQQTYKDRPTALVTREIRQLAAFLKPWRADDIVVAADGMEVLGIARITGPYEHDGSLTFPHLRKVNWLSFAEWRLPQQECLQTTFCEFKKYQVNRLEVERRLLSPQGPPTTPPAQPGQVASSHELPALPPEIEEIQQLLAHKPQVILYGPPGTGKTFWARNAARELASRDNFRASYDQLSEAQREQLTNPTNGYVRMCSFHAGYGYEDFIEGYRPQLADKRHLYFEPKTGIFKHLCDDASADVTKKHYYLIIDEINRGDLPRIFGELMTVLEKDKRGQPVTLPGSGKPFSVPANLLIIATMNTADRSISLLDVAFRRRFGFIEILPKPALLKSVIQGLPVGLWLDAVNGNIRKFLGPDGRNLQIGHSYFMPDGQQVRSPQHFAQIFRYEVYPLLEEYCYGKYEIVEKIFGKNVVDATAQRLRTELFDKGHEDEMVDALLANFPDLITTHEAVTKEQVPTEDSEQDDES